MGTSIRCSKIVPPQKKCHSSSNVRDANYTPRRWLNIHESPSGWLTKTSRNPIRLRDVHCHPFLECTKNAPTCFACECFNVYFHQSQSISHTEMKEIDGPLLKFTFFCGKANLFQLSPATMELVRMFWDVEPVLAGAVFLPLWCNCQV